MVWYGLVQWIAAEKTLDIYKCVEFHCVGKCHYRTVVEREELECNSTNSVWGTPLTLLRSAAPWSYIVMM